MKNFNINETFPLHKKSSLKWKKVFKMLGKNGYFKNRLLKGLFFWNGMINKSWQVMRFD